MVTKTRNYDREAKEMVAGLGSNQKYELYEIVLEQLQRRSSDDRTRELKAVQFAIERDRSLDATRLTKMKTGDTVIFGKEKVTAAKLPELNIGDEILGGKFKNKRMVIKGFGKDKYNQPIVKTDKGDYQVFKFRLEKLMNK